MVKIRRAFLLARWALSVERSAFRHLCCRGHECVQTKPSKLTILVARSVYFNGFIILSAFYFRDYWNTPVFNL